MLRIEHLVIGDLPPLSFRVADGECMAVEGPSGSGKTRLLRALADLDPVEGQIFLDGAERAETPAPLWRKSIRYVAAEPGWWTQTPREGLPETPAATSKIDRLMPALGLQSELLDSDIAHLSTGERQRLALLRALLDEPRVLLLDEPTASLDTANTALVEELIRFLLLSGKSVMLTSHDTAQVSRLAQSRLQLRRPQPSPSVKPASVERTQPTTVDRQ